MAASFPASAKSFTTRVAGDTIQPAHINDIQDEVAAVETKLLEAWTAFVPTWTNLTVGNGTLTARYYQIGKLVYFKLDLILGSTTSISGSVAFTLPVTATAGTNRCLGSGELFDTGTTSYPAILRQASTTTAAIMGDTGVSLTQINVSIPFGAAWANTDEIHVSGVYEAA